MSSVYFFRKGKRDKRPVRDSVVTKDRAPKHLHDLKKANAETKIKFMARDGWGRPVEIPEWKEDNG
jgi:hypothetical protein